MSSQQQTRGLRRDEAEARAAMLEVTGYDLDLDLARDEATFTSRTVVTFRSTGGSTFVDLKPVSLGSITLDGRRLDPDALDGGRLPLHTDAGEHELVVEAVMAFRNDGEGLHRSVDPADGRHYVYGMSFMDAAPSIFACFDQPDLKAPYRVRVRVPTDWVVAGNAPATETEPGHWSIGPTPPLSTYFVTVVAGPYHLVRSEHDGIGLSLSARASLAAPLERDAEELFTLTRQCFDEFHRLFGIRYAFGDYHQAFVPEFNAGAMENPGCVTFRDTYVFESRPSRGELVQRATTIAHEMAHQWFGNLVTPRWWDDLWLNESFAEYMGNRVTAEATAYDDAWLNTAWARRQWGLVADQGPSTHPVAGNGAVDAVSALQDFDGISYTKGSTILKQLATSLGDEVFFGGAVDHFEKHRFGNATMHDLVASWERAGAGDLDETVRQWLTTAGPDTFTLDRDRGVLRRTPPADHPAERSHTFDVARLDGSEWTREEVAVTGPEAPYDAGGAAVVLDPDHASWGVYVPDEVTVRGLVAALPRTEDPALVAAAWNNVKSGYTVAAVDPDAVVDLLVAAYPLGDPDDAARHTLPWVLAEVLPLASPGSRVRVHDAVRGLLDAAEPGSADQLTAFRAAVSTADDAALLRGWLDAPPAGIEADLLVRWRLWVRLARLGATDAAELDAALAAEATAVSRVEHARARAALPTEAAKAWAWDRFTGAADVTNYEMAAAGAGLWSSGGPELLRPYVARYVTDLAGTAAVRSGWNLATGADAFFPRLVDEETLAAVRPLLADEAVEASCRRKVADRVDGLERALAVRAAWPKEGTDA